MGKRGRWLWIAVAATIGAVVVGLFLASTNEQQGRASATSVDQPGDVVLDWLDVTGTQREIIGWRRGGGVVEITADGVVIATMDANIARLDVALAHGLDDGAVGFRATVTVPADALLVCATSVGAVPASGSCNRTVVDLDHHRVVAFYGVPGAPGLGTLGSGTVDQVIDRLERQATPFVTDEIPVVPAFEIIATVAQASAGADGDYSEPIPTENIWEYLEAIREIDGQVILDFQPGQGDYMEQIQAVEELLLEPDVHLALDPEWDMLAGQRPGQVVGHTRAAEINEIMAYIDGLVRANHLPPKIVIVHQFQVQMVRDRPDLDPPDTVQLLLQMDGHGPPALKTGNYTRLADERFHDGFKVFYARDIPLMSPADVLELMVDAELVSYQ